MTDLDLAADAEGRAVRPSADVPVRSVAMPVVVTGAVLVVALVGWLTTPEFVTYSNLQSIIRSAALIGIIAETMTFITIGGSYFSLSVSQTAAMSAIAFAAFLSWGWPVWASVVAVFAIAAAVGLAQGGAVALGGNPIVVTLAAGAVLFGSGAWLTDNKTVRTGTDAADWIGTTRPLGVPTQTWAFLIITVMSAVVLARTRFGRAGDPRRRQSTYGHRRRPAPWTHLALCLCRVVARSCSRRSLHGLPIRSRTARSVRWRRHRRHRRHPRRRRGDPRRRRLGAYAPPWAPSSSPRSRT